MARAKRKVRTKSAATVTVAASPRINQPQKWQLQTAKAKFSEVFRRARTEGPQHVVKHGKEEVVVIAQEEFDKLTQPGKPTQSLAEFLLNSPLAGSGIDLERRKDYGRKVEL
jgi:prevent-host-death family protein